MALVRGKGPNLNHTCYFFGTEASAGCSQFRLVFVTVTPATPSVPAQPTGVTATSAGVNPSYIAQGYFRAGAKRITVTWNAVSDATYYKLQWYGLYGNYWAGESHSWVPRQLVRTHGTIVVNDGLVLSGTDYVRVQGCNSSGCGSWSASTVITAQ